MTKHDEATVVRANGEKPALYAHVTEPAGAKLVVGLLHGYADHGARYAHVTDAWAEKGITTVALTMRGHGKAEGRRGHCERFQEFVDDAAELTRLVKDRYGSLPPVLFGHSFGGLVASAAVIANPGPWRALALSSPYFDTAKPVPAAKRIAGRIATRLAPALALPTGLSGKDCTHDAARARAYDEDPLVFGTATARWFSETQAAQAATIARAPSLHLPLLVVMGLADPIVSVPRARAFFDAVGSKDKTWDGREGLFHETWNEPEWRGIADRFADWMLAHAGD
ncbi:MAG TPA: alpha/beta hydrolase [Polyangiaceae bacterium]|jgi:alpha-beta hydrolase superfamily lysophospholipase